MIIIRQTSAMVAITRKNWTLVKGSSCSRVAPTSTVPLKVENGNWMVVDGPSPALVLAQTEQM